jgi:hypothetical protein
LRAWARVLEVVVGDTVIRVSPPTPTPRTDAVVDVDVLVDDAAELLWF